jgi:hypothetical protein
VHWELAEVPDAKGFAPRGSNPRDTRESRGQSKVAGLSTYLYFSVAMQ